MANQNQTMIYNSNDSLSDFDYFKLRIAEETLGETRHFLRVSTGITKQFLHGNKQETAQSNWGCKKATKHMILTAIWEFYRVFDRQLYRTFTRPRGIFTNIVWAKFRALYRQWEPKHQANLALKKEFAKRLTTDAAKLYILPTKCDAPTQFYQELKG